MMESSNASEDQGDVVLGPSALARYWFVSAMLSLIVLAGLAWGLGWLDPLADRVSPNLMEVTGRVFYNGQPLTTGFLRTHYEGGRMGALGPIEADGAFRLMTNGEPGAYSGRHRVMVICMDGGFPPKSVLPERYSQPQTTPLIIAVSRRTSNRVQLDLADTMNEVGKPR